MTYSITQVRDTEADEEAILSLHRTCFPDAECYPVAGSHWWLAHTKGSSKPVAFAGLAASPREGGAYLCRAGVAPAHRGQGLQVRLIKLREAAARRMDLNYLVSDTVEGNVASANNLIDCGFRLYLPITPWGNATNLYWRKELI